MENWERWKNCSRNLNGVCGLDGHSGTVFISWFWWLNCSPVEECPLFPTLISLRRFTFCSLVSFLSSSHGWLIKDSVVTFSEADVTALSKVPSFPKSLSLCLCYSYIHCYLWLPSYVCVECLCLSSERSSWQQRPSMCGIFCLKQYLLPSGPTLAICWISDWACEVWPSMLAGRSCNKSGCVKMGQRALAKYCRN